jgi:hypothetical protein
MIPPPSQALNLWQFTCQRRAAIHKARKHMTRLVRYGLFALKQFFAEKRIFQAEDRTVVAGDEYQRLPLFFSIQQQNRQPFRARPKCGARISPDDHSEVVYSIHETVMTDNNLTGLVLYCKSCLSFIHLTGFSNIQKTLRADFVNHFYNILEET